MLAIRYDTALVLSGSIMKKISSFVLGCYLSQAVWALNPEAIKAADYADNHYRRAMIDTLRHLYLPCLKSNWKRQ